MGEDLEGYFVRKSREEIDSDEVADGVREVRKLWKAALSENAL